MQHATQTTVTSAEIFEALSRIQDPDLRRDIVTLGFVKNLCITGDNVTFTLQLTTPACPVRDQMQEEARRAVLALPGVSTVAVEMTAEVRASKAAQQGPLLPQVKNIIPIASGKGGVGKSTLSANLAIALAQLGARVGLMDADVYGPSIPLLMGANTRPVQQQGQIVPPVRYGVKLISMGFFAPQGEATIWRGPMLAKVVDQFLSQVAWGELDYLLVDLPPGTGDVQLSLCQKIPLTGAVVVSTPQDLACQVAEKAILMFQKLHTSMLGLVENMSGFECRQCGHREDIFGSGGTRRYALQHDLPFLGEIPLDTEIRTTSDAGCPVVQAQPASPSARAFVRVAENLTAQVSILHMGGAASARPEPVEMTQPSPREVRIVWQDGHASVYTAYALRLACRCALCIDEQTGQQRLNAATISPDIAALAMEPVGRYAVRFRWSDGHTTGLYTFEHLRGLCLCSLCTGAQTTS